ncbi:ADP-ribose diphosphatase [Savitreella phatthalungensis]
MAAPPTNGSTIVSTSTLQLDEAKWTTLKKITWRDPAGKERVWESAERVTNGSTTTKAVGILAFLKEEGEKTRIVLERQFRPPVGAMCVEVPAGMLDAGESAEVAAERELKEETGYVGVARKSGNGIGLMYNDPGFTDTSTSLVYVDIDLSDERNKNVQPEREAGEFIEVITPQVDQLEETLAQWEKEGYVIDARLGAFAMGLAAVKHI